ncbi:MAG TPA: DUF998 domain-containing protein [Candidatus Saccharimonadales bacterium]|nr:DUF998 domain-containing protein [Candidatus Saccharimonadales bacterium]
MSSKTIWRLTGLGILAGLLYNSWPFGFWLNPAVEQNSLASGLEAVHQPYNWVFIATDISSSVIVAIMCLWLWRAYRHGRLRTPVRLALMAMGLFAAGTIVDALMPEHCVPNLMRCPSFTQDHILLLHGIFSIAASVFLFIALFIVWLYNRKAILLNALLVGYMVFGVISLIQAILPGDNGNWSQDYYITLCSLVLVCFPYAVSLLGDR